MQQVQIIKLLYKIERNIMEILTLGCPECKSVIEVDDMAQTTEKCHRCDCVFLVIRTMKTDYKTEEEREDEEVQEEIRKLTTPVEKYDEYTDPKKNPLIQE